MAWTAPKTNWTAADGVTAVDMNNIGNNLQYLADTSARYNDAGVLFVRKSGVGTSEGGQIDLEMPDTGTQLTNSVTMDVASDFYRIFTFQGGKLRGTQMYLPGLPENVFSNIATFTAGTDPRTPGVSWVGPWHLYMQIE